jgi:hypothetical protein
MFTPPSVNQIASAYQGNPAPLAQKVDQDKKQHGGIPQDLRQLLALNDITQMRQGAGIQAALNAPPNMPTVAEDVQAKAKQALQARMVQEAQKQMAKDGRPGIVPMGVPQPRPQPENQGIDALPSNVGESYFHGGVVSFDEGGPTPDTRSADDILREQMRVNEEDRRKAATERQRTELGAPDTSQIDRLMAELETRKAKLAAPKPGYDAMMEYLAQIASAPLSTRSSAAAGAYGAQQQNALQRSREEQQNALTERAIDLAQKKADVGYQYKKDLYQTGNTAAEAAIKQKYDAAIQVAKTDQEKLKLAQEKDLELKKLAIERDKVGVMKINPALQIADALQKADPDRLNAIREGIASVYGNRTGQADAALLGQYERAIKEHDTKYKDDPRQYQKAEKEAWKTEKAADLEGINKHYSKYNIGPLAEKGLPSAISGATPSATPSGVTPLPPSPTPDKLTVGTVYQTAKGPAKWNGKGFEQ